MKRFFIPLGLLLSFAFLTNVASAQSSDLFFNILPKQLAVGERLTVEVRVRSGMQSINAVSGFLSLPESLVRVVSISKDKSIIDLWTREPVKERNGISFEGIILNPGFQGGGGTIFQVTLEARKTGTVALSLSQGAVLANDGRGTNILGTLGSTAFQIVPGALLPFIAETYLPENGKLVILPVITEYSPLVLSKDSAYLKGKGAPDALTKIVFKDISSKSVGEKFVDFLQTKKKKLDEVLVKNDASGIFQFQSGAGLVAGVYNATPFLVDTDSNTEKPGLGVQLLVTDSKVVKALVVVINVLGLLIPIVGLGVIIYFIPWYSFRRMRVLNKKLGLEEEKIELSEHELARRDKMMDKTVDKLIDIEPKQ